MFLSLVDAAQDNYYQLGWWSSKGFCLKRTIRQVQSQRQIGGHTLSHVRLTDLSPAAIEAEVSGCYRWLSTILPEPPVSFCFPIGAYNETIIGIVKKAGFRLARTTELLSLQSPDTTTVLPTTLQVYEHGRLTYLKHLLKRFKINNLILWMKSASASNLLHLTDFYIEQLLKNGGCFHLWGHSWEIEEYALWDKLETILKHIANIPEFSYLSNKDLPLMDRAVWIKTLLVS